MSSKSKIHMKRPKTHEEARLSCCAACGRGGAKLVVTAITEGLIRRYAHPSYNASIQSYPGGLCKSCKTYLYQCKSKGAAPREEWTAFKLEEITIPRLPNSSTNCSCSMCHTSHYNPVGVKGEKKITLNPVINTSGGSMRCEIQQKVIKKSKSVCEICLQLTGRGIRHKCSDKDMRKVHVGRSRSSHRPVINRRKRNISVLVGSEADDA